MSNLQDHFNTCKRVMLSAIVEDYRRWLDEGGEVYAVDKAFAAATMAFAGQLNGYRDMAVLITVLLSEIVEKGSNK